MSKLIGCFFALTAIMLGGCNSVKTIPASAQACPETRPMICTMDYRPACGYSKTGSFKTYSNRCSACADPEVTAVVAGECKATTQ